MQKRVENTLEGFIGQYHTADGTNYYYQDIKHCSSRYGGCMSTAVLVWTIAAWGTAGCVDY